MQIILYKYEFIVINNFSCFSELMALPSRVKDHLRKLNLKHEKAPLNNEDKISYLLYLEKNRAFKTDMVVYICYPNIWESEVKRSQF